MRIGILDIFHSTTVLLYEYEKDIGAVFCRTCICVCRRTARDYSNVRLFTAQITEKMLRNKSSSDFTILFVVVDVCLFSFYYK